MPTPTTPSALDGPVPLPTAPSLVPPPTGPRVAGTPGSSRTSASSTPSPVAPPLTLWGKTWRPLLALGTGLVALGAVLTESAPSDGQVGLDLLAGIVALSLVPFRRRTPLLVALLVTALAAVTSLGTGALVLVTVSLATRRRWREVLPVAVLWFVALGYYESRSGAYQPLPWWGIALVTAAVLVPTVLTGFYIGGRRELLSVLQARAETAEREQASRVAQARTAERAAIAREMHDVLAHRISLVALHSGALAYREDLTREQTTEVATVIRDNAHLALSELREVLGVLRAPDAQGAPDGRGGSPLDRATDPGAPDRPQPTIASLTDLVADTRSAGTPVTLRVTPTPDALGRLTSSTGRTVYRIVQEALTNARKHAPGCPVTIDLAGVPGDRLTLVVSNPVGPQGTEPLPPSGLGLAGLTERAALAGGHLEHGDDGHGTFTVRAWVPWTT